VADDKSISASSSPKSSELVHTFGIEDYDAYWEARDLGKGLTETHEIILELLPGLVSSPAKILELGPGPGYLLHELEKKGYSMHACDISKLALEQLKLPAERMRQADLNQGFPEFGLRFRAIIAGMVLHHMDRPETLLANIRGALEDGGLLILNTPNLSTLPNRLRFLFGHFPKLSRSHKNFMTPWEVRQLLEQSRLKVLSCLPARRKFHYRVSPVLFSRKLIYVCQAV